MNAGHQALIVEDDRPIADDLSQILQSFGCACDIVTNKHDALAALRGCTYCLILLDLQIKIDQGAVKGHTEHGSSLLREIRQRHSDHTGLSFWLPIIIVSGFAREGDTAVEVMKDGANDVIHKPLVARQVSEAIRRALERSGRATHDLCAGGPAAFAPNAEKTLELAIPGDRVGRRTRVTVGARGTTLTDSSLKVLLHLMVAHEKKGSVHKRDLGGSDGGFKGISVLRDQLKPALGEGVRMILNDKHGNYYLTNNVTITSCDAEKLGQIGDRTITELSRELRQLIPARSS